MIAEIKVPDGYEFIPLGKEALPEDSFWFEYSFTRGPVWKPTLFKVIVGDACIFIRRKDEVRE